MTGSTGARAPEATHPGTRSIRTGTRWVRQPPRQALAVAGVAVLVVVVTLYPLVITNAAATSFGVITLIFVAVTSAWNLFSGYSGYLSLGHAIFYGTGAYFLAVAAKDWSISGSAIFWLVPLGGLAAALIAIPVGLVALRVRRHTFVVITIAFFFIAQLSASNLSVTGGSSGILVPPPGSWDPATYNNPFYYVALIMAGATVALSWQIRRSRFGLQLRAIRDDEDRAAGLGVRAMPVKLAALVLSAFITGMAGALWVFFIGEAFPQFVFDPLFDLAVVLMAFFGGLGTLAGPVLGALVLEPVQQYLTQQTNGYESEILFGALFLVVILFLPRGVVPTAAEYASSGWARRLIARWPLGRGPRDVTGGAGSSAKPAGTSAAGTPL